MGEAIVQVARPTASRFEAWRISPDGYAQYWPDIERELDRIPHVWNTHWTKESLYEGAMSGRFQVWGFGPPKALKLIVYTQVAQFPAARILEVFLCFGNSLDSAMPVIEATLEKFALVSGCHACEIFGRKGWGRKATDFRESRVVYRREFSHCGVH